MQGCHGDTSPCSSDDAELPRRLPGIPVNLAFSGSTGIPEVHGCLPALVVEAGRNLGQFCEELGSVFNCRRMDANPSVLSGGPKSS